MVSRFNNAMNRTMTEDQFCQVVEAILNGKYSWACLLILQFSGYNPLHYIPYRTYNRLIKENRSREQANLAKPGFSPQKKDFSRESLTVVNLPHVQTTEDCSSKIRGGFLNTKDCDGAGLSYFL